jgi:hypothetical protein
MLTRRLIPLAFIALLTACSPSGQSPGEPVSRYTTIARHQFSPARLTVPPDTPFRLIMDVYDSERGVVVVSGDALGIPRQGLRSHTHTSRWPETDAPERKQFAVEGLSPGRYSVVCECHGKPATLTVDVSAPTSETR